MRDNMYGGKFFHALQNHGTPSAFTLLLSVEADWIACLLDKALTIRNKMFLLSTLLSYMYNNYLSENHK